MTSSYVFTDVSMHTHLYTAIFICIHRCQHVYTIIHTHHRFQAVLPEFIPKQNPKVYHQSVHTASQKPQVPEERPLKTGAAAGFSVKVVRSKIQYATELKQASGKTPCLFIFTTC